MSAVSGQTQAMATGPLPMGDLLRHQAERDPTRPAYTFEGETLTRQELAQRVDRMAAALHGLGVGQGDAVSLVLSTGPQFIVAAYALWKLGATPNPLPRRLTTLELSGLLQLLSPKLVIGGDPSAAPHLKWLPADFEPDPSIATEPQASRVSNPWKISPSGGSTGRPKLIVDHNPSLMDPSAPFPLLLMQVDDVILHPAPTYHNAPFTQIPAGLCAGAHVIQMAKFDALEWLRLVERHRVRWAYLVPTMMNRIWSLPEAQRNGFDLSSLEVVMHMAAPCPAWLKGAWIDWLGPERIWEVYGGTEAVGGSRISGVEWLAHRGSVGKPMTETEIRGADGRPLPAGEIGEVFFRLPPERAGHTYMGAETRAGEWQTYGDVGWLDADGYLYLADRRTDIIISGGVNLYPAEVESALEEHPAIVAAAVVGLPHPDLGAAPHAIVELASGAPAPAPSDLREFLRSRLAGFKLPRSFEIAATPIRDDAGKVRRSQLRDNCVERLAAGTQFTAIA